MKKVIYGTIALFVGILILTMIIAEQHPVRTVKYEKGVISETSK